MKRKGFTLIELLAVIAVLAIISTIATTIVIKYIDSSKSNLLQVQKNEIVQAAKDWSLKNTDKLDKYHLNNTYISIDTLKETGFLENKKIINPVTKKEMEALVNDLRKCENPYTCPHGRPTTIFYSNYEIEKLFKRDM